MSHHADYDKKVCQWGKLSSLVYHILFHYRPQFKILELQDDDFGAVSAVCPKSY